MPSLPPGANLFLLFTERFDLLGDPYMVSGSVASMIYGEPRLTNDLDLITFLSVRSAARLAQLFPAREFYCPPRDVLLAEISREQRGHFNIIHHQSGFKADIYLRGSDVLHAWALPRARRIEIGVTTVSIAPPEYVILRKLEYFREGGSQKHLRDIGAMLRTSPGFIDLSQVNDMVRERDLTSEWEQVNKGI